MNKRTCSILLVLLLLAAPASVQAQFTYTTNNGAITLTGYSGAGGAVVISNFVTSIGYEAFYGNQSVTTLTIPNSVTSIGMAAFYLCTNLTVVTIGNGLASLGSQAFYACTNLTGAYFQGNAPSADSTVFAFDYGAMVYLLPGTSGWSSLLAGRPTVMLNPPNPAGSLQVTIIPPAAGLAGAQWQVDGGVLQPDGAIVLGLAVGSHTVSFTPVSGWAAPSNQVVSVSANSTMTAAGNYTLTGFLSQGIDPLYLFSGSDGYTPVASLIQASNGFLYGTVSSGGSNGGGVVFQISTNGAFTPLYSFSYGNDGGNPIAGLIQAGNGFLYGTTAGGGTNGVGAVFQISTNGAFTPLYSFTSGNDGAYPAASLIQAGNGCLYGTTSSGGTNGDGTVFQISTNGVFTPLYSFTDGNDGGYPVASLVQATDGFLYGTAENGGTYGYGTVFRITTNGAFTPLYSFTYGDDGAYPAAGLIQAADGFLYGTAENGGTYGYGTIFQISTNGSFTSIYSFTGGNDGANPVAGLIQSRNGYLFGTASGGGINGAGTVFLIKTNGGHFRALSLFTGGEDGANPVAGLIQASDGNFYGTASQGGVSGLGTLFVLDPLQLSPRSLQFTAQAGGPIPPVTLTLVNMGTATLNWSVANTPWLNFSSSNGPLAPGASLPLAVSPTSAATNLPPGVYSFTLDFTNLTYDLAQSIQVSYDALLTPLASFPGGDGANPYSPLLQAGDGNLYGTTAYGGNYGNGAVFQISPNGAITTLYSFTGGNDGSNTFAGLIQAGNGYLYGTTEYGGTNGYGTVFQISTNGAFTTLYSFTGADDGGNPTASLIQASDGNLYGTASGGDFYGTVFRITTGGQFTVLYSFTGVDDGAFPEAALVQASDGWLYGTANQGGINGVGTIFRVSTNGVFQALFSFNRTDGAFPAAPLVQAADGYLYGTASSGGNRNNYGTVFRISTNGAFNSIHLFTGGADGSNPNAGLIQDSGGWLYGTASGGGTYSYGTVFQISTNGAFTPLYSFTDYTDGGNPAASLIQARDGFLYGTASQGGNSGYGTVFKITVNGVFTALHSFIGSFQVDPSGALLMSGGNLYGTTQYGGTNAQGAIFRVAANGALTTLFSFNYISGNEPQAGLIQGSDGYFYGTTYQGGTNGYGTVFKITTNGAFTSLHSFNYSISDGISPEAALVQAGDGYLYGTTYGGGTNGYGTVFKISTNGAFTLLHSFNYSISNGAYPRAALVQAGDGWLYGTTYQGGTNGYGTIFKISTNGAFSLLHSFNPSLSEGFRPEAALVQAGNGYLYGTTTYGGPYGAGTVFQISTNGAFTTLYWFTGGNDGAYPVAGLIQAANGILYGTTSEGGVSGSGAVFQITTGGTFTSIYSFSGGEDGSYPAGGLTWSPNGWLYGITLYGGANGNGAVFALPIAVLAPLTIAFTANPTYGMVPLPVKFTSAGVDSAGNAITSWKWSFGDGSTSTAQNPSHTYTATGAFSLALIATNNLGAMIAGSGPVSITGITPAQPGIASFNLSGTNLVLNGVNGQSGGTYYVLMSTNIALPLSQWTPVATNVLGATGNFTITATNAVNRTVPRRFYILQTP